METKALWILVVLLTAVLGLSVWRQETAFTTQEEGAALRSQLAALEGDQEDLTQRLAAIESEWPELVEAVNRLDSTLARRPGGVEPDGEMENGAAGELARLRAEVDELKQGFEGLLRDLEQGRISLAGADPSASLLQRALDAQRAADSTPPTPQAGSNPEVVNWDAGQVLGEPDTFQDGDQITAWATRNPDAGPEWIEVDFPRAVAPRAIIIRETYNPGAVVKVEAVDASGQYHLVWEGEDPTRQSPDELEIDARGLGFATARVRVHLDTSKVPGWNELDAIGLRSAGGTIWASDARASSSYSESYASAPPPINFESRRLGR